MKEMIVKITNQSLDVEILVNDLIKKEIVEKKLSAEKFLEILNDEMNGDKNARPIKIKFIEPEVIGFGTSGDGSREVYIINQKEHKRYVTYSVGECNRAYSIHFPSSIYKVRVKHRRIESIEAFMYTEFKGKDTTLYKYAMANMLSGNNICIGNAERDVGESIIDALEKIIYAPYSHATLNNIKGFESTETYFKYLSEHSIDVKYLYASGKTLGDLFN